jgi:hypothetical protein
MRVAGRRFVPLVLAVAIGLGSAAASPWASGSPDGLQKVAQREGFADTGRLHAIQADAPVPDYAFPGVADERLAGGLAGFAGTLVAFALGLGAARVLRRRSGDAASPHPTVASQWSSTRSS